MVTVPLFHEPVSCFFAHSPMGGRGKMKSRETIELIVLCILAAAPLRGQTPPGRWEKVEMLQPGTGVSVRMKTGDRLNGAFSGINQDALEIIDDGAQARKLPKSVIQAVEKLSKKPDRLCNGTLIGALVGVAGGIAGMVAFGNAKTNGPVHWGDEEGPGYLVGAALAGGAIGAATGAIVDASIKHPEVLYKAKGEPSP
jgi:hypothetical protein